MNSRRHLLRAWSLNKNFYWRALHQLQTTFSTASCCWRNNFWCECHRHSTTQQPTRNHHCDSSEYQIGRAEPWRDLILYGDWGTWHWLGQSWCPDSEHPPFPHCWKTNPGLNISQDATKKTARIHAWRRCIHSYDYNQLSAQELPWLWHICRCLICTGTGSEPHLAFPINLKGLEKQMLKDEYIISGKQCLLRSLVSLNHPICCNGNPEIFKSEIFWRCSLQYWTKTLVWAIQIPGSRSTASIFSKGFIKELPKLDHWDEVNWSYLQWIYSRKIWSTTTPFYC